MATKDQSKFTCWFDGTSYHATSDIDSVDIVASGNNNATVLQNAINLFANTGFICSFAPSYGAVNAQITINVSNWELRLPIGRSFSVTPPVSIQRLTIENTSSTEDLANFKVSGGLFYQIDILATDFNISQGSLEYLILRPTTTAGKGGLFIGGSSDTGYIQYISFDHVVIQDNNPGDASIHYRNTITGTAHHCYNDLQYLCDNTVTSPTTVFQFAAGLHMEGLFIDQFQVNFASSDAGSNGSKVFDFLPSTVTGHCRGIDVAQLYLEGHNSDDIICNFQAPASGTVGALEFSGYLHSIMCTTGGGTHYIVNVNARAAWSTSNLDGNKLRIGFGSVGLTTGNLELGTLLQSANWWVYVDLSAPNGIKSGGSGIFGNPLNFVGTGTKEGVDLVSPAGDSNMFTRGTAYQVRCGSAIIVWSAAATASLSDPNKTPIASLLTSPLYVPEGFWVTFSGTGSMGALVSFWGD
jgi:hypothetical protein